MPRVRTMETLVSAHFRLTLGMPQACARCVSVLQLEPKDTWNPELSSPSAEGRLVEPRAFRALGRRKAGGVGHGLVGPQRPGEHLMFSCCCESGIPW